MNIKYSTPGFAGFGKWQATLPEEPHLVYCTNKHGEGLFIQRYGDGDVRQIRGTGQFRANDFNHFKALMRKIRKEAFPNLNLYTVYEW